MSQQKTNQQLLARAISITSQAFENKLDKGGNPYILHCLRVMHNTQGDIIRKIIAILHDLVEDTGWTLEDLKGEGFPDRVLEGVRILTHDKATDYDVYIKIVATNEDTRAVKLADLKDNSDITRLKGLKQKDFERLEKYCRSFVYLSE